MEPLIEPAMAETQLDKYLLDRAGQLVAGRYRIESLLGAGGMGSIWIARNAALRNRVVVKFHEKGFIGSQARESLQRFLREAKTLSTVRHVNVTELFESGTNEAGEPYLIMEYLEGETLMAKMRREGVLPLDDALRITAAIADGLGAAHDMGVLHRDVKPENIFLRKEPLGDPTPKLLDFGLAREVVDKKPLTAENRVVGTPGYFSPEQARGRRDMDARVDIYSLGVTLYEMLTHAFPSEGETATDHMIWVATRDPIELKHRRPDLAGPPNDVVMKALALKRDDRYPDARRFRDALLSLVGGPTPWGIADTLRPLPPGEPMTFSEPPLPLSDADLEPIE